MKYYCKPYKKGGYNGNVFNGLRDVSGLVPGDELIISGLHDEGYYDNDLTIDVEGVTVKDDRNDPSLLIPCGMKFADLSSFSQVQHGAYSRQYNGSTDQAVMQGNTLLTRYTTEPNETWEDGSFSQVGNMLYIKPLNDQPIYTYSSYGYKVHAPNCSLINLSVDFSATAYAFDGADDVTVEGCSVARGGYMAFKVENSQRTRFKDLTATQCANAFYSVRQKGGEVSDNIVISGFDITDNDPDGYWRSPDNHGIGIQNGDNHLIEDVSVSDGEGSGVTFYAYNDRTMRDVTLRRFDIRNMRSDAHNGRGVEFVLENAANPEDGAGFNFTNGTIDNCKEGVFITSPVCSDPAHGKNLNISHCDTGLVHTDIQAAPPGLHLSNTEFYMCDEGINAWQPDNDAVVLKNVTYPGTPRT